MVVTLTHVTHPKMVTHDLLTHFHLWARDLSHTAMIVITFEVHADCLLFVRW